MSFLRQIFGRSAEKRARRYLQRQGLRFVAQNWEAPPAPGKGGHGGEIDLIMRDDPYLVIVEVRAQKAQSLRFGGPAYTIDPRKQRKLWRLGQRYCRAHNLHAQPLRFDVVTLIQDRGRWEIRWYRNAIALNERS